MLTIVDSVGVLATLDRSSRTFAKALERGDIVATGTPLVFKLVRGGKLLPRKGSPEDLAAKWAAKHGIAS